jgi:hypothetical protein
MFNVLIRLFVTALFIASFLTAGGVGSATAADLFLSPANYTDTDVVLPYKRSYEQWKRHFRCCSFL